MAGQFIGKKMDAFLRFFMLTVFFIVGALLLLGALILMNEGG